MGDGRPETGDGRREMGDGGREMGDGRWETGPGLRPQSSVLRRNHLRANSVNQMPLLYSFGFMAVILDIGITIFNRVEQTFMDTV
jgi:hypothetical protein